MRTLGRTAIAGTVLALLAAIWIPEHRWQLAITALVLLIVGAAILGNAHTNRPPKEN